MISQGLCRPTSPGLHAFSISSAVGLHDCGDVDIHTLIGKKGKVGPKEYHPIPPEMGPNIDFSHKNCQEKS